MSQRSISSFFTSNTNDNKNRMKRAKETDSNVPINKKSKTDIVDSVSNEKISESSTHVKLDTQLNPELQDAILKQCEATPLLHSSIGETWFQALKEEFAKPYFKTLSEYVCQERKKSTVFPSARDVFSWTRHTPLEGVKVVILGQDPYHGPGQAHGLCFSVMAGVTPPPSLKNMYKELVSDIDGFKAPGHGYLVGWAQQGVLMINAVLTVKQSNANSHKGKGWEQFTSAVIAAVAQHNKGVIFLLWGKDAHKRAAVISKQDHHLLESVHPSPLSAHRGFLGCKHFSKCNELLQAQGKTPIDWTQLPL